MRIVDSVRLLYQRTLKLFRVLFVKHNNFQQHTKFLEQTGIFQEHDWIRTRALIMILNAISMLNNIRDLQVGKVQPSSF